MKNSFNDLTLEEMIAKRDELRQQYLKIRMDRVLGHIDNPLSIRTTKRQIARLNTLIHEYALGIRKTAN
ncbi:MAG: 50S ribosomal protein L29 [Spirochaetia bacterium]|jgi:large subunit ribosomal protein L29|nr:50S ribosomal protein L29 [Spirochaetia bacterium]